MLDITRQEYTDLLEFRTLLRKFLRWSEDQARAAGLTPAQHQLLLAIKGHPGPRPPTISELSECLVLRHHSTVELIDRASMAGLVERWPDPDDGRIVRIRITPLGDRKVDELAPLHLAEIRVNALVRMHLDVAELGRLAPPLSPLADSVESPG